MLGTVERARSERGIAVPVALWVIVLVLMLAAVSSLVAIAATSQSRRDTSVKRAVATVDAGVEATLYRLNKVQPPGDKCVKQGPPLSVEDPWPDGWCPWHVETLGDGETYLTRMSTQTTQAQGCQTSVQRRIVSVGMVGGVVRRSLVTVGQATGALFGECGLIGLRDARVGTNYGRAYGDIVSNGEVKVTDRGRVCGDITAPERKIGGLNAVHECGTFTQVPADPPPFTLPAVDQGCASPVEAAPDPPCNDNARITSGDDPGPPLTSPDIDWDAAGRDLQIRGKATLKLTGNVYSFCYLKIMGDAKLVVAPRTPNTTVKIFMDDPENCPDQPDTRTTYVRTGNSAVILNTNADPTTLQLYMVSGTNRKGKITRIWLKGNTKGVYQNMVVYAPESMVVLRGPYDANRVLGAIAADRLRVWGKASVTWTDDVLNLDSSTLSVTQAFAPQSWVECAPVTQGDWSFIQGCDQ